MKKNKYNIWCIIEKKATPLPQKNNMQKIMNNITLIQNSVKQLKSKIKVSYLSAQQLNHVNGSLIFFRKFRISNSNFQKKKWLWSKQKVTSFALEDQEQVRLLLRFFEFLLLKSCSKFGRSCLLKKEKLWRKLTLDQMMLRRLLGFTVYLSQQVLFWQLKLNDSMKSWMKESSID